jgi:ribosomal protein S18 acetylase RimI-like enzyme
MPPAVQIRRLEPADAQAFQALRLVALGDCPSAFSASLEEEAGLPLEVVANRMRTGSGRYLFGAFDHGTLVGCVGVGRETARKVAHKGFVRGLYVAASARGAGVGRRLMTEALAFAATLPGVRQVSLVATAGNTGAIALYESLGFNVWGREPDALHADGEFHDDVHMSCPLPVHPKG